MKNFLVPFLFMLSTASAQMDTIPVKDLPDSTGFGTPDGALTEKQLGPEGGIIVSSDGKMKLVFPAGALTAQTTISIQPTTNLAPNGSGKSYEFRPSGIQFKKPVTLIYNYSQEEAEECPPELMGLAMQDHTGKWHGINYEDWDSVGKSLTGYIQHFSYAANVFMLRLKPAKKALAVTETTRIDVKEFNEGFNIWFEASFTPGQKNRWYVNDAQLGNAMVGYLEIYEETDKKVKALTTHAKYTAPEYLLQEGNPVTISLQVKILSGKRKGQTRFVSCRVRIYDSYKITARFITRLYFGSQPSEVIDTSSFVVRLFPNELEIVQIENHPPVLTISKTGKCTLKIFTEGADGSLHLTEGYNGYRMSRDRPPEVWFRFLDTYEKRVFSIQWICPWGSSAVEPVNDIPYAPQIQFIANGQTQRIKEFGGGDHHEFNYTVVPFRK